jgi:large subunit ribosomal protein L5
VNAKAADNEPVKKTTAKVPAKAAAAKTTTAKAQAKTTAPKAVAATEAAPKPAAKSPTAKAPVAKAATKAPAKVAQTSEAAETAATETQVAETQAAKVKVAPRAAAQPAAPAVNGVMHGLHLRYRDEVAPALQKEFNYSNPMEVPRLSKIVVNIGLGEALTNAKALDAAVGDLATITGQKPIVTRARRSIAQFKIRTGNPIGAKVTLRGQRMWDFLERLTRLALPRIRDFRGVPDKSFDGRGNYSLGLREQLAFPEIDYDKIDKLRGLEVSIVTTARTDEESKRLLQLLGMPFAS